MLKRTAGGKDRNNITKIVTGSLWFQRIMAPAAPCRSVLMIQLNDERLIEEDFFRHTFSMS
jgi:hypothetical protein